MSTTLTKAVVTKIGNVCRKLDTAVRDTFRSIAVELSETYQQEVGNTFDIDSKSVEAIVEYAAENATWSGTSAEKVRKSELRAVIKGAPFLKEATETFQSCYYNGTPREGQTGPFGKEQMLKIARMAPEYETAEDVAHEAIFFFRAKDNAVPNETTQEERLIAGLKQARKNCKGSKMLADLDDFLKSHKLYKKVTG